MAWCRVVDWAPSVAPRRPTVARGRELLHFAPGDGHESSAVTEIFTKSRSLWGAGSEGDGSPRRHETSALGNLSLTCNPDRCRCLFVQTSGSRKRQGIANISEEGISQARLKSPFLLSWSCVDWSPHWSLHYIFQCPAPILQA